MIPPPYPRIAHLFAQPGADADDRVLPSQEAVRLLARELLVEEKLDGFNLSIARDERGWPQPFARSGKSTKDRGGQLGRVRAFIGHNQPGLDAVLDRWPVLYAEWMMRQHSVGYDALPAWLIVLDLWSPASGFASVDERDRLCRTAGLSTPPRLYEGIIGDVQRLEAITMQSRFGSSAAEGVVLRDAAAQGQPPVAKWLSPSFRRRSDDELQRAGNNRLRSA